MNQIYVSFDWIIEEDHLIDQHFIKFMDTADELYCTLWVDWWAELPTKNARRLVLRLPSATSLKQLIERAGTNLGLTAWSEVTHEYFLTVTKDRKVPSLQEIRRNDIDYFNKLLGGFMMRALRKLDEG